MLCIAFLSNKLTLRGTEIAMYDYADYNETYLHNKSIIITRDYNTISYEYDVHPEAYEKFKARFTVEYYQTPKDIDAIVEKHKITHLYVIKAGTYDGLISTKCKNLIHAVFDTRHPHGDIYAAISEHVNELKQTNVPVVPHMIRVVNTNENARSVLQIPDTHIVFGNYGGADSFNIEFVKTTVVDMANKHTNMWFLFMNVYQFAKHPRIIFLPGTSDLYQKRVFINTCDAFLHARSSGETFGLACGEFAVCLKPVITYGLSPEINQIRVLSEKAIIYNTSSELIHILETFTKTKYDMTNNKYLEYTPENVMNIFNRVFLTSEPTKLYFSGFWPGFYDGTDANTTRVFVDILSQTKLGKCSIVQTQDEANILIESLFAPSRIRDKQWKHTIYFTGEPYIGTTETHSILLNSEYTHNNTVNFPLIVSYIECNRFYERLVQRPKVTKVPSKFCCFIVSNGTSKPRNKMFELCNTYKRVDSYGKYNNNMGDVIPHMYHTQSYFDMLSEYKFIICFENTKKGTYITEKLINPYLANIIPVYWGTEYVKTLFNMDSLIYVNDETEEAYMAALNKMIELDNNDELYLHMVNQCVFQNNAYPELVSQIVKHIDTLL